MKCFLHLNSSNRDSTSRRIDIYFVLVLYTLFPWCSKDMNLVCSNKKQEPKLPIIWEKHSKKIIVKK